MALVTCAPPVTTSSTTSSSSPPMHTSTTSTTGAATTCIYSSSGISYSHVGASSSLDQSSSSSSCSPSSATPSSSQYYHYSTHCDYSFSSIFPSCEIVSTLSGRLYWTTLARPPPGGSSLRLVDFSGRTGRGEGNIMYFSVDRYFEYEPFFADFGPLNLALTYRYCQLLDTMLTDPSLSSKRIVHYCSHNPYKRANAAYLMCAYQVLVLKRGSEEVLRPFCRLQPSIVPFRDATYGACTYALHISDCIRGLEYAIKLGWFNYETFDVCEYEHYERVENGDLNWVIPGIFLAFSGPSATSTDDEGCTSYTPEDYVLIFKALGIKLVIRLNKQQYDRKRFTHRGLNHVDMYFMDGSCPSRDIINRFLEVSEKASCGIAVHCKAGLGRTGSLIGCYAMKHYRFPAAYWIGWNRICRPGSILGPQQHFLSEIQNDLFQLSPRRMLKLASTEAELAEKLGHMSLEERRKAEQGDAGQGERLVHIKRHHPHHQFYLPLVHTNISAASSLSYSSTTAYSSSGIFCSLPSFSHSSFPSSPSRGQVASQPRSTLGVLRKGGASDYTIARQSSGSPSSRRQRE